MPGVLKKYWFLTGLALVFAATLADWTGVLAEAGRWCKNHHGPDLVISVVFFLSGMILDSAQIKAGLTDITGTLLALFFIFAVSPLIAALLGLLPVDTGIKIGLFLVAVMPTTMSSGVVMTGAAGGRMAHALVITVTANILAVFTIPVSLSLLLELTGRDAAIVIDKAAVMAKIGMFVVVPLAAGLLARTVFHKWIYRQTGRFQAVNQVLIMGIVWMGISQSKPVLLKSGGELAVIVFLTTFFHLVLLSAARSWLRFARIPFGRMESIMFMGIQKTLPLSVILQVTLFPEYGLALLVCVGHHFISLMIDGFLVGRIRSAAGLA